MNSTKRVWATDLNEGVDKRHLASFYAGAFGTILCAVLINALQPYLLTSVLGIPLREQGQLSGKIGFVAELVLVLMVGVFGVLSDRIGRRLVYASGFFLVGLGFALTPHFADPIGLLASRALFAFGIAGATAMLATLAADYVQNHDRGKANAIMGIMNGLGAVAAALGFAKLPRLFQYLGQSGNEAAVSTYTAAAVLAFLLGLLMLSGLKKGGQQAHDEGHNLQFIAMAREGITAARKDPGIALCYAAAFVSRADLAVAGVFFPLWLNKFFASQVSPNLSDADRLMALDLAAASGIAAGGKLIAIVGGAALFFAPVIGILCDRINRISALVLTLILNVLGYGLTLLVADPTQGSLLLVCIVIGFGQVGAVIASQVLIQEFAPVQHRGSIIGCFGTCGALGIMCTLLLGGMLFDQWREAGPFALLAGLNLLVAGLAFFMRRRLTFPVPASKPGPKRSTELAGKTLPVSGLKTNSSLN